MQKLDSENASQRDNLEIRTNSGLNYKINFSMINFYPKIRLQPGRYYLPDKFPHEKNSPSMQTQADQKLRTLIKWDYKTQLLGDGLEATGSP